MAVAGSARLLANLLARLLAVSPTKNARTTITRSNFGIYIII